MFYSKYLMAIDIKKNKQKHNENQSVRQSA